MEAHKKMLLALFYPFTIATCAAGFIAFVMMVLKFPFPAISTVVLSFYSACGASLYLIFKPVIGSLGMRRLFLSFVVTISILAILSAVLFIWEQLGGAS